MSAVPAGGNTAKTIIIGILTTVAAYAIVHFLGIGKGGKGGNEDFKQKKEATVSAWKSVNDYVNYANQKFQTIACFSCDQEEMKNELVRELESNITSLRGLKEDKQIDNKMQSIIDRTISQFSELKPIYVSYFDSLIAAKTLPISRRAAVYASYQEKYLRQIAHVQSRDSTEIKNYLKDVNTKFKVNLIQQPYKLEFEPNSLVGKWRIECQADVEFKADHTITWVQTADGIDLKGTWTLTGEELAIKLENGEELNYSFLLLNKKMFVYYNPDSQSFLAGCPQ